MHMSLTFSMDIFIVHGSDSVIKEVNNVGLRDCKIPLTMGAAVLGGVDKRTFFAVKALASASENEDISHKANTKAKTVSGSSDLWGCDDMGPHNMRPSCKKK